MTTKVSGDNSPRIHLYWSYTNILLDPKLIQNKQWQNRKEPQTHLLYKEQQPTHETTSTGEERTVWKRSMGITVRALCSCWVCMQSTVRSWTCTRQQEQSIIVSKLSKSSEVFTVLLFYSSVGKSRIELCSNCSIYWQQILCRVRLQWRSD